MKTYQSLSKALFTALVLTVTLLFSQVFAKAFVLPHILESSGKITNTQHTFDTQIFMAYDGALDSGVSVDLYLYDGGTGELLRSATGTAVCGPCTQSLGLTNKKVSISVENAMVAAGGFPGGVKNVDAFAVAVASGDTASLAISEWLEYANSGPLDLSIAELKPTALRESPTLPSLKRVFVLPHVLESSGKTSVEGSSFDFEIEGVFTGGILGSVPGTGADLDLYLYDNNGSPMMSATGVEVCNPCTQAFSPSARKRSFNVDDLITAAGGFNAAIKLGFGIIVVGGADPENVAVQGFVVNSHTSAMDLSVFGFDPVPIQASPRMAKAEVNRPGLAKGFSGSPNPTASGVNFNLNLLKGGTVSVELFSLDGRKITTAYQGTLGSGAHVVRWNGSNPDGTAVAPGNYFARLSGEEGTRVTRLVVLR